MKPLFTVNRRDKRRPVQTGGGGGGGGGSTALTYNPGQVANLGSSYSTYNIPTTGTYTKTLTPGELALFVLPTSQAKTGRVQITGSAGSGNIIHIIGGQILHNTASTSGPSETNRCLVLQDIDTVYLEGLVIDRDRQSGTGIALDGAGRMKIYIQQCRIQNIGYQHSGSCGSTFTQHGDWLHVREQLHSIFTDKVTATFQHTGFSLTGASAFANQFLSGSAVRGELNFKRTNGRIFDSSLARNGWGSCWSGSAAFWLYNPCSAPTYPVKFDDVWINDDDDSGRRTIIQMLVPPGGSGEATGCTFTITGDSFTGTATPHSTLLAAGWSGVIRGGIPTNGDFVPSTFTGLNYTPGPYQ